MTAGPRSFARTYNFTVKPTDFCNLACKYCYSPNLRSVNVVSDHVLNTLVERLQTEYEDDARFCFVWHGSEPLGVGVEFYRSFIARLREAVGDRTVHHVQSNLSLLDEEWLDLFAAEGFSVSTSLDGPRALHDQVRVNHAGRGTFDELICSVQRLRDRSIPVGAITVLTPTNARSAAELYALAREFFFSIRINPAICEPQSPFLMPPDAYGRFIIELAEEWLADPESPLDLEPIRSMAMRLLTQQSFVCDQQELCYSGIVAMGTDGSLYPCNRFINVPELKLGHISTTPLRQLPLLEVSRRAARRHLDNAKCTTCRLVDVCHGGCMFHAHVIFGDAFREDYFCESYVLLYDFIIANLSALIQRMSTLPAENSLRSIGALLDFPSSAAPIHG